MRPFTNDWAAACAEAINASDAYAAAAHGWRWPLTPVMEPAPEHAYPDRVTLLADLYDGTCRDMPFIVAAVPEAARWFLSANSGRDAAAQDPLTIDEDVP